MTLSVPVPVSVSLCLSLSLCLSVSLSHHVTPPCPRDTHTHTHGTERGQGYGTGTDHVSSGGPKSKRMPSTTCSSIRYVSTTHRIASYASSVPPGHHTLGQYRTAHSSIR
eukprot:2393109-Rhodomonas_salina.1